MALATVRSRWTTWAAGLACLAAPAAVGQTPLALRLAVDGPLRVLAARPVVVPAVLRNVTDRVVPVAAPDGRYNTGARFEPSPTGTGGFYKSILFIPEPRHVVDLPPGGEWRWSTWLDAAHPYGLPPGRYRVTLRYGPSMEVEAWGLPPVSAEGRLVSPPVELEVVAPTDPDDVAAWEIYRREVPHYQIPGSLLNAPGQAVRWRDLAAAARLLALADQPAVRALRERLPVPRQRALARLPLDPADERALQDAIRRLLPDGPLLPEDAVAGLPLSPLTRELLAADGPRADPVFRNRCLLADVLPGCVEPSLLDLIHDYPRTPYAPLAMFTIAGAYRGRDPARCLYWLDELARAEPDFPLRDEIRWLQVWAHQEFGHLAEQRAILPQIQDGWQEAQRQLRRLEAEPQQ